MKIRNSNDEIRKLAARNRSGNGNVLSFGFVLVEIFFGGTGFQPVVFGILPKTVGALIAHEHFRFKKNFRPREIRQDAGFNRLEACSTRRLRGFTLIEMILAVGIAAIVLVTINAALFTTIHLRNDAAEMVDEATPVDSTAAFLKRDLQNCVTPTNGTSKILSGSFRVGNGLNSVGVSDPVQIEMFTTTGALSTSQPWGEIQRVTYELKNPTDNSTRGKDLYRGVLRNLLAVSTPQVEEQFMLSGVESVKFSCYDGAQWQEVWDTTSISTLNTNLPLAVKVEIQMAGSANAGPVQVVVPIDAVARTNMVFASTGN